MVVSTARAPKPARARMTLVVIPKAAMPQIDKSTWSGLFSQAQTGAHGMRVMEMPTNSLQREPRGLRYSEEEDAEGFVRWFDIDPDVALFRQGTDIMSGNKDRAFLYGRNW